MTRVHAAAEVAGRQAGRDADAGAERDRDDADQQRGAAAVDDPRQEVAAEVVGAEEEALAGRQQLGAGVLLERVVRADAAARRWRR